MKFYVFFAKEIRHWYNTIVRFHAAPLQHLVGTVNMKKKDIWISVAISAAAVLVIYLLATGKFEYG